MLFFKKKTSSRRSHVRKGITAERFSQISSLINIDFLISALLWLAFVVCSIFVLTFDLVKKSSFRQVGAISGIAVLIAAAIGMYIHHFQKRILKNHLRALALSSLFIMMLAIVKIGVLFTNQQAWGTSTAVAIAIILSIAYDQRFAIGMSLFYCFFAYLASGVTTDANLFLTMIIAVLSCCFSLREIRTRMKLLEVGTITASAVFVMSSLLGFLAGNVTVGKNFNIAAYHALAAFVVALLIQSLLPLIEKVFRISTSMTLLDYSDANQPLLKRLAIDAPGTYSHSLLVGSIAEAAAESIDRNGLLCRVGSYYHDIGKINKPNYFVENEAGTKSRHDELSPAMSQLVIIGHVKDGIEMAKEYGLPMVLHQFITTHHGTTLVAYFFNEAKKKQDNKQAPPSEAEFRYAGPKPRTKEAAIVMLSDASEGAVRSLAEPTATKIEGVVHNMAMKRLQDGQFDECDLSLRELSSIEASISKTLAAHYHGRLTYPDSLQKGEKKKNGNSQ